MRTKAELFEWIEGATAELGDPSKPVGLLFIRLRRVSDEEFPTDVVATFVGNTLTLDLRPWTLLPIEIDPTGPKFTPAPDDALLLEDDDLTAFGVAQIQPGLWALEPSLNIPQVLHVFVVLYDVPVPAPWEQSRIITV